MSHHFDTKLAREDPRLNLCDFYLFDGPSGKTVMAMTVNPHVRLSAPDTLHPEGLYAFRFDLNGDAREEVTFKFRFGEPRHGDGSEHTHIQPFVVRKATGDDALRGDAGESLVEGETGSVATDSDLRAYVGIAPELFAANAGFGTFMTASGGPDVNFIAAAQRSKLSRGLSPRGGPNVAGSDSQISVNGR